MVSLLISLPFLNKIALVNLVTATVREISTCFSNTDLAMECFRPQYMTMAENGSILVTADYGIFKLYTNGSIEPIINPLNYIKDRTTPYADGNGMLSTATVGTAKRLVPVKTYEGVFVLVDILSESIRVINLAAQTVYTLCANHQRNRYLKFDPGTPQCILNKPSSLLLTYEDQASAVILIGTEDSMRLAKIRFKGSSLKL